MNICNIKIKHLKHMSKTVETYICFQRNIILMLGRVEARRHAELQVAVGKWSLAGAAAAHRDRWCGGGTRSSSPRLFVRAFVVGGRERRHAHGGHRRRCERSSPARPSQPPLSGSTSSLSQMDYFSSCCRCAVKIRMDPGL